MSLISGDSEQKTASLDEAIVSLLLICCSSFDNSGVSYQKDRVIFLFQDNYTLLL